MKPDWWADHRDCPQKRVADPPAECYCPKCPVCQHRPEMHTTKGCQVITELRHKVHEDNIICGCEGL